MKASAAAPALLFLAVRSARNALLRQVRRLREPRYLVGFLIAIGYFSFVFRGPMARIRGGRPGGPGALPTEAFAFVHLGASALLLGLLALFWVFRRGSAALSLSESEAHFLFAAPLTRSAIVHYALLRPQLGVLFGSFILTVMSGRIARPGGWRTLVGSWLALATVGFHLQAMGFFKARLRSRGLVLRITAFLVILGAAASAVTATALWLLDLRTVLPALPDGGSLLRRGALLWEELLPWRSRFVPSVLLVPFRLFLAPLFAPTATAFLAALPGAAVLLLLNYAWLMRTSVAYEEATLAAADAKARRNALRVAMREGIALPAEGQRTAVPFDLAPAGRPELAVTWKNLLVHGRTRLATLGRAAAIMALGLVFVPFLILRFGPDFIFAVPLLAAVIPAAGVFLALLFPLGRTNDFRGDLRAASVLKTWPLPPERLVLGTLLAPWLASLIILAFTLIAGAALAAGLYFAPGGNLPGPASRWAIASAFTALLLVPPASALVLLVQNVAVLAFPAWFSELGRRSAGFEATGIRLLAFLATLLTLAVAFLPGVLLAAPVLYFGLGPLGPAALPLAAIAASMPFWALIWGGVKLVGFLWDRFDPSSGTPL